MVFLRAERSLNNILLGVLRLPNVSDFNARFQAVGRRQAWHSRHHGVQQTNSLVIATTHSTATEAELQPILQGAGAFNRIPGPNATPGNYNGILIARVNTDITLADFEARSSTSWRTSALTGSCILLSRSGYESRPATYPANVAGHRKPDHAAVGKGRPPAISRGPGQVENAVGHGHQRAGRVHLGRVYTVQGRCGSCWACPPTTQADSTVG
jgi:hypothetical protein